METKQHSRGYLYISKQHSTKRRSIVYHVAPSSEAVTNPLKPRFGVIERLYSHSFAQRYFMWAAVSLYKEPCYDSSSGLWCLDDLFDHTVPVLLSSLSHPLTIAHDGKSHV